MSNRDIERNPDKPTCKDCTYREGNRDGISYYCTNSLNTGWDYVRNIAWRGSAMTYNSDGQCKHYPHSLRKDSQ